MKIYEIKLNMDEVYYYSSPAMSSQLEVGGDNFVDPLSEYDLFVSNTTPLDRVKSELERYLEEPVLSRLLNLIY